LLVSGGLLGIGEGAGVDEGWLAGVLTGVELELEELELEELELEELELEELELTLEGVTFPPLSKMLFWAPSVKPHSSR